MHMFVLRKFIIFTKHVVPANQASHECLHPLYNN